MFNLLAQIVWQQNEIKNQFHGTLASTEKGQKHILCWGKFILMANIYLDQVHDLS